MLKFNSKVSISSARFQDAMVRASALVSATFQLFVSVDEKGKPYNPVKFRLPTADGGIAGAIKALMGMKFDAASEKTKKATGIKLAYPPNTSTRIKTTLGTWIEPRKLAAIVNFLHGEDAAPTGMEDAEYAAHIESAGLMEYATETTNPDESEESEENEPANNEPANPRTATKAPVS